MQALVGGGQGMTVHSDGAKRLWNNLSACLIGICRHRGDNLVKRGDRRDRILAESEGERLSRIFDEGEGNLNRTWTDYEQDTYDSWKFQNRIRMDSRLNSRIVHRRGRVVYECDTRKRHLAKIPLKVNRPIERYRSGETLLEDFYLEYLELFHLKKRRKVPCLSHHSKSLIRL